MWLCSDDVQPIGEPDLSVQEATVQQSRSSLRPSARELHVLINPTSFNDWTDRAAAAHFLQKVFGPLPVLTLFQLPCVIDNEKSGPLPTGLGWQVVTNHGTLSCEHGLLRFDYTECQPPERIHVDLRDLDWGNTEEEEDDDDEGTEANVDDKDQDGITAAFVAHMEGEMDDAEEVEDVREEEEEEREDGRTKIQKPCAWSAATAASAPAELWEPGMRWHVR